MKLYAYRLKNGEKITSGYIIGDNEKDAKSKVKTDALLYKGYRITLIDIAERFNKIGIWEISYKDAGKFIDRICADFEKLIKGKFSKEVKGNDVVYMLR